MLVSLNNPHVILELFGLMVPLHQDLSNKGNRKLTGLEPLPGEDPKKQMKLLNICE